MCMSTTALKAAMFIMSVLLFLCGGIIMGIGIWAVADKIYISDVVGNSLFKSAAILMTICGVFLVLISFMGCICAITQKRALIAAYAIILGIIFIVLMTAGIVAAVFQDDIGFEMKAKMRRGLTEQYGYNTQYSEENARLTEAWDLLQTKLMCCAVEDQGWLAYQGSRWYAQENSVQYGGYSYGNQKIVPPSCCVYEGRLNQYLNQNDCQTPRYMPTNNMGMGGMVGPMNTAIHYKGCYTAAVEFVESQSELIIGIGFGFCVILISSIVVAIIFFRKLAGEGQADFS